MFSLTKSGFLLKEIMKKLAIMTILAAAACVASATDIGLRADRFAGASTNGAGLVGAGITVGQQFGKFGAELAYDRALVNTSSVTKYSLTGSYPVAKVLGMTVAAKAGVAFIDPTGTNGYAATVGAGVSYPLTKTVSLVADYSYQIGQSCVQSFDGNMVSFGTKYSF